MNENIDLTKILENCPEGFPLYSTIYGNVTFLKIINNDIQFIYSYKTACGTYKCKAYVNLKGNPSNSYNGECTLFPSKEQRDWSKFTAPWYKKEKFDPNTLQQYDRVLVRDYSNHSWKVDFYSHKNVNTEYQYRCVGNAYRFCIPYNDDTKHLVGTNKEVPEYYKYWED